MQFVFENIPDAFLFPKLIKVKPNLFLACFDLIKLIPARYILQKAAENGRIKRGSVIIESSSGTFGLALAMYCRLNDYKLILISDPIIDESFKRRLEDLGATVEIVDGSATNGNVQKARLERMDMIKSQYTEHFCPGQYIKPENIDSYSILADYLSEQFGSFDYLIGTVGTGGSMCGTTKYLRQTNPGLISVGIDTFNSVLFGMKDGPRALRGLGNCLKVPNVSHTVFDDVHWVSAELAFRLTRQLHQNYTIFQGPTSGAAYGVADWYAKKHPDAKIVCLCPDSGHRYIDTIYNNNWLKQNNFVIDSSPAEPVPVNHPAEAYPHWACLKWNRRTYEEVTGDVYISQETK